MFYSFCWRLIEAGFSIINCRFQVKGFRATGHVLCQLKLFFSLKLAFPDKWKDTIELCGASPKRISTETLLQFFLPMPGAEEATLSVFVVFRVNNGRLALDVLTLLFACGQGLQHVRNDLWDLHECRLTKQRVLWGSLYSHIHFHHKNICDNWTSTKPVLWGSHGSIAISRPIPTLMVWPPNALQIDEMCKSQ